MLLKKRIQVIVGDFAEIGEEPVSPKYTLSTKSSTKKTNKTLWQILLVMQGQSKTYGF
jgi:hypothetical protein